VLCQTTVAFTSIL